MTNIPGPESPGSSSDSPEPDDGGQSPASAPAQPPQPTRTDGSAPRWSAQQPPPASGWASWTPPQGVHPGPAPNGGPRWSGGWGAPPPPTGGWQPGPWSRPQAPKSGVIPLRPLGIGEMLDGAFSTLRLHWRAVLTTTVSISLVTQGLSVVIQGLLSDDSRIKSLRDDPNPSVSEILHSVSGTLTALGLTSLVTMIGTVVATGMIALSVSRAVLGRPVTIGGLWRDARPRLPQLLGLTVLIALLLYGVLAISVLPGVLIALAGHEEGGAALGTLGFLGGTVISIWFWGQWSLASTALMLEKQRLVAALKRSAKLVSGNWWRVVGVQFVGILLAALIGVVIKIPFSTIAAAVAGNDASSFFGSVDNLSWTYLVVAGIGQVIGSAITLPISAGVSALLYMDQRIRRESLDVELLRSAAAAAGPAGA